MISCAIHLLEDVGSSAKSKKKTHNNYMKKEKKKEQTFSKHKRFKSKNKKFCS